jgi:hypothetical protein
MALLSLFKTRTPVKAFEGTPLLKLCSLFADTYEREGE